MLSELQDSVWALSTGTIQFLQARDRKRKMQRERDGETTTETTTGIFERD
jgi:hypothetical protein